MFCRVLSAAIAGVEAFPVSVEADMGDGMPYFAMVGFVSSQVREAQDRVKTALKNLGIALPPKRITINLAPGYIRKEGTRFDLPIACAVLEAMGLIAPEIFEDTMIIGELHLDGSIGSAFGVLPSVIEARKAGCSVCIVPMQNLAEGQAVSGIRVIGFSSLRDILDYSQGVIPEQEDGERRMRVLDYDVDFADIQGQESAKRAAVIAAAGFHNLLLMGSPGSGKSMTAERIPTILPELDEEESLEITKIYSVAGLLPEDISLIRRRPYRAPHHTVTQAALCGGGSPPRPGEVTLAHRGVLFLDELPEMNPAVLEMLRQPLEDKRITISRLSSTCTFPAAFLLVAAMNPCPCGYYPNINRCSCTPRQIQIYQSRISQAILDRIDLRCEVMPASYEQLTGRQRHTEKARSSAQMRAQVMDAAEVQADRYRKLPMRFNSELRAPDIERYCTLSKDAADMLKAAYSHLGLSARGYHHVLKVSRTIADLDHESVIKESHVSEALCFRCQEKLHSQTGKPGVQGGG